MTSKEYWARYSDENRDILREKNRLDYHNNKSKRKAKHQEWRKLNQEKIKDAKLRRVFGITLEDYNTLYSTQNGTCAICNKPETLTYKGTLLDLAVGHDHKTGKIRGLLCSKHNKALGMFNDDPDLLKKALEYLQ